MLAHTKHILVLITKVEQSKDCESTVLISGWRLTSPRYLNGLSPPTKQTSHNFLLGVEASILSTLKVRRKFLLVSPFLVAVDSALAKWGYMSLLLVYLFY